MEVSANLTLRGCTVVGAAGYEIEAGLRVALLCFSNRLHVEQENGKGFRIPLVEVSSIDVSGPGAVTSGGGFVGGGFGVAGAMEGIAIAAVLNALTSKTKMYTFISLITNVGELHLHFQGMEPGALRVALGPTYVALRGLDTDWILKRRSVLDAMRNRSLLSDQEYEAYVSRLESVPKLSELPTSIGGRCPSCKNPVPMSAERCRCGAMFVGNSLWRIEPPEE